MTACPLKPAGCPAPGEPPEALGPTEPAPLGSCRRTPGTLLAGPGLSWDRAPHLTAVCGCTVPSPHAMHPATCKHVHTCTHGHTRACTRTPRRLHSTSGCAGEAAGVEETVLVWDPRSQTSC